MNLLPRFSQCFLDGRNPDLIEHPVEQMLAQRIYGLALGYEDLNDHEQLRYDPRLGVLAGKAEPGQAALAGKSTLNRMELGDGTPDRYKKITFWRDAIDDLLVDAFLEAQAEPTQEIVLDIDTTDFAIHGEQEGRFYHGYYDCYCYLPLYIFCGEFLLCARLRRADIDASAGTVDELKRIVAQIREKWSKVRIVLRGDSGFCREEILSWCESNGVDYVIGLAKNDVVLREIETELEKARKKFEKTGEAARLFKDFPYSTKESWSRKRRVIAKAEYLPKGPNPRFVVTSFPKRQTGAQYIYERTYCARGDMENRIKEQQLGLFADRTSTATMHANQLRLYFSSMAYLLVHTLRRYGLKDTELAGAQCETIRLKLLKIGAQIQVTVRRVWFRMAEGYPYADVFAKVYTNVQSIPLRY
jgi:hypothetical protein